MTKKKLAVIGASHFQMPLIERAQEKGCEVHAFAWQCGDVGETAADVFHPVSITEVDEIVRICREVGVDGICTIASDLATVAVSHVAEELSLTGNSVACMERSTNKNLMRRAFEAAGDPSPRACSSRSRTTPPRRATPCTWPSPSSTPSTPASTASPTRSSSSPPTAPAAAA